MNLYLLTIVKFWLGMNGKRPELDVEDLFAEPIHAILNELRRVEAASKLKLKLSVYDDFGKSGA